jgi:hypothetical protein
LAVGDINGTLDRDLKFYGNEFAEVKMCVSSGHTEFGMPVVYLNRQVGS